MPPTILNSMAQIQLDSLTHDGRTIAYAQGGLLPSPEHATHPPTPVLAFYPLNGSRRFIAFWHAVAYYAHVHLICVSRPGHGETSLPSNDNNSSSSSDGLYLDTIVSDIQHVLDHLKITQVALMAACAGYPMSMAFACRCPERCTRQLISVSGWVLPADCGRDHTSAWYALGASSYLPHALVCRSVGWIASSVDQWLVASLPTEWLVEGMTHKMNVREQALFQKHLGVHEEDILQWITWMRQEQRGPAHLDLSILLSPSAASGIDYAALVDWDIQLWYGTADEIVYYNSAQWLAQQLPHAQMKTLKQGTHMGLLMLLFADAAESLSKIVKNSMCSKEEQDKQSQLKSYMFQVRIEYISVFRYK
jgi:pimeloyl-ACP methyl ester carboxylesterase